MKVVILAGGEGKRLRPLTDSVPKPLVKINGVSIIDRQIETFRKLGCNSFIILAGYKNGELQSHFANYKGADVKIMVEDEPLGTGGAIKSAQSAIGDEEFIVMNGDIMTDIDLSPMLIENVGLVGKIALVPMRSPYGVIKTFNDKIVGFEEKPILKDVWINAGCYWLGPKVFDYLPENGSIEHDTFPKLALDGKLGFFRFQIHDKFWRSIDTIKDYEDAGQRFV